MYPPALAPHPGLSRRLALRVPLLALVGSSLSAGCDVPEDLAAEAETSGAAVIQQSSSAGVHIQVVSCHSGMAQHNTGTCLVDPDYVLVGGGAVALSDGGPGGLLTASMPVDDGQFRTWTASSKDHNLADHHQLLTYAVGLKLDGVPRSTLLPHMQIKSARSGISAHPRATVATDPAYLMIGGGAKTVYPAGAGTLLTATAPEADGRTWFAAGKDHMTPSPGSVEVYVIGIARNIPGFGRLDVVRRSSATNTTDWEVPGEASVAAEGGWLLSCPGAVAEKFIGPGRLLHAIQPQLTGAVARDKDHQEASIGELTSHLLQVRRRPGFLNPKVGLGGI